MVAFLWHFWAATCFIAASRTWPQQVDLEMNDTRADVYFLGVNACCVRKIAGGDEWMDETLVVGTQCAQKRRSCTLRTSCGRLAVALLAINHTNDWHFLVAGCLLDTMENVTGRQDMTQGLRQLLTLVFGHWRDAMIGMDKDEVVLVQRHRRKRSRSLEEERRQRRQAWLRPTGNEEGRGSHGRGPARANAAATGTPGPSRTSTTRSVASTNATTPTRTCSWVRVPRRSDRVEPASSSTRRPQSTTEPTARADAAPGVLTGERQSEVDPELYLWRQMLSFLHPLEGDRPENASFAAINADIYDTVQLNFREMSLARRQRSVMAFLRLIALLFAEVTRAMMTGSTPDGSALLQTFNIWPTAVASTEPAASPREPRATDVDDFVEVVVDDEEPDTAAAPVEEGSAPEVMTHRGNGSHGIWSHDGDDLPAVNVDVAKADELNRDVTAAGPELEVEDGDANHLMMPEAVESEQDMTEDPEDAPEIEDLVNQVDELTAGDEPGRWLRLLGQHGDDDTEMDGDHLSMVQTALEAETKDPHTLRSGGPDNDHVALVQGRVQAVQRFGYLLGTLQQDLDRLQHNSGAAARIAQLLLTLVIRERRAHPAASTGDRAEKFRALEALLVSYGASPVSNMATGSTGEVVIGCPPSSLVGQNAASSSSAAPPASQFSAVAITVDDQAWLHRHWEALRCYLLVPLFGSDDSVGAGTDSQLSADSVEITGEIMVQQEGVWRLATDEEREQIQGRDQLEKEMEEAQAREDEERWRDYKEQKKSQAAQAWDRQMLQDAMQSHPRKKMRLHFRLRNRDGNPIAEGSSELEVAIAEVHSTETWFSEPAASNGLRDTEEPNVGSAEFDQLVVHSSQQLPSEVSPEPPQLEGQDGAVVAAYLAMYQDGSLPDETIEDRFGPAALQLFKARRFGNKKLLDDPDAWQVFRGWSHGEVSDEDVIQEYGMDFLVMLRNEVELQGGTTPPGLQGEDNSGERRATMDDLQVVPPPAQDQGQGSISLWNSEDNGDRSVTKLYDSRESEHVTTAAGSSQHGTALVPSTTQVNGSATVPVVVQQTVVGGGFALENEMVAELGAEACGREVPSGGCWNGDEESEICDKAD